MFEYRRQIRFQEVDAAGILFFPIFLELAHEAMEAFFDQLEGCYAGLLMKRRVGLPTVKLESDFRRPLRFGDEARIQLTVSHVGTRSLRLSYAVHDDSGALSAQIEQVVVCMNLDRLESCDMPADVRALAASAAAPPDAG